MDSIPPDKNTDKALAPSLLHSLQIIGIGTSAGGLEALQSLFDHIIPHERLAYVIVQHLSPDYKSLMVELLSKHTSMEVIQVQNGMEVVGNKVYVMPPKNNLSIKGGILYLTGKDPLLSINFPIDIFFHALAEDQKEDAVAIILSGTGTDGTRGIKTIKEMGGIIMVQEPNSAKFNGMLMSAISTNLPDYVLSPPEIAVELNHLIELQQKGEGSFSIHRNSYIDTFQKILGLIYKETGIDFSNYKRNTLLRRLERRMKLKRINNLNTYYDLLMQEHEEINLLQQDMLIGVTQFFRDPPAFTLVEKKVIPYLFEDKNPGDPIRIWIPGCCSGEEAYSILILIEEYKRANKLHNPVKIFATDLDDNSINTASLASYPVNIAVDVPGKYLQSYFTQKDGNYQVIQDLRNQIVFARHNIFSDPPFNRVDMIVCRNLLIYMDNELQRKILSIFLFALQKDGFLFLGPSESLGEMSKNLEPIDKRWKIFRNKLSSRMFVPEILSGLNNNHVESSRPRTPLFNTSKKVQVNNKNVDQFRDLLIDRFSPMAAFINENLEVLYLIGGVTRFLRLPEKKLTLNLLKMIPEELNIPISTAIHKVLKSQLPVIYKSLRFDYEGEPHLMDMTVELVPPSKGSQKILLLSFELISKGETENAGETVIQSPLDTVSAESINFLTLQLKDTRETLQATIEELEMSNEELQASNEELMAANEELQSTNEELQSVNEELHTVNSELQLKIHELSEMATDMDNLLVSTDIGTIFLDEELRIRKFTPAVQALFNFMIQDIGRPIQHFNTHLGVGSIVDKAERVLQNETLYQEVIQQKDGHTYLMRILPYMLEGKRVAGIVITFMKVDQLKQQLLDMHLNDNPE